MLILYIDAILVALLLLRLLLPPFWLKYLLLPSTNNVMATPSLSPARPVRPTLQHITGPRQHSLITCGQWSRSRDAQGNLNLLLSTELLKINPIRWISSASSQHCG
jgi:hypothetical protein